VLLLAGGPEFHAPAELAAMVARLISCSPGPRLRCEVLDYLNVLADARRLARYDLFVSCWSGGTLTTTQPCWSSRRSTA
jgi:hypothetical protein